MRNWKCYAHVICASRFIIIIIIIILIIVKNAPVLSLLWCSFVNQIFQEYVLPRLCVNAIHQRRSNTPRQNRFLQSSNRVVVQGKDDYWLFSWYDVKSAGPNKLCCFCVNSTCYPVPQSVFLIRDGTSVLGKKLTYHLIQCDGTTAQIINATKEVSCVYNQAALSHYRKGV